MNIQVGSFFSKGESHLVNQDYCVTQNNTVVLSDGCSSGMYSDSGSRILAHSYLASKNSAAPWFNTIHRAYTVSTLLELPSDCLCATLLTIEPYQDNILVNIWGDGCVVARHKISGELEYFNISFLSNAPYYLKYHAHEKKDYLDQFGDKAQINQGFPFSFFERYPEGYIKLVYPIEAYDLVAVFSDGITSFLDERKKTVSIETITQEILAFKSVAGSFVERRCRRAFENFKKFGWSHHDDFSVGVLKVE